MPSTHYTNLLRLQTKCSGHSALILWSWDTCGYAIIIR